MHQRALRQYRRNAIRVADEPSRPPVTVSRGRRLARAAIAVVALAVATPVAILVAFRTMASRRETRTRAEAAPPTGHFVRAADVELFVQEAGPPDGRPVLLIHGTGAWSEIWRSTMDTLAAQGFRAVAIDMPPFGYSQRPANANYGDEPQARRILGVINSLNLDQVTLVGHSFGGRPTMEAFFLDQSRVAALVLVDAALGLDTVAKPSAPVWPMRAALATPALRNSLVAATLTNPALTARLLRGLVADSSAVTPTRVAMLQRPFVLERTTVSFGEWLQPFVTTTERSLATDRARYAAIQLPTLIVWGDRDSITPIAQGHDLASLIPNASWAELKGAGHIPAIEATERFNHALLEFLESVAGQSRPRTDADKARTGAEKS
jgi:pimeloyl-ACP methyl ester carboxylesterase